MGGIITGVRTELAMLNEVSLDLEGIVKRKIKMNKDVWREVTVYNREKASALNEQLLDKLKVEEEGILIIAGDFNARTGGEGDVIVDGEIKKRVAKDRVKNANGAELLKMVEERSWCILNGNKEGDAKGEFTYVGVKGETIIDYALANTEAWERIEDFRIEERVESDHQPITVEVESIHPEERRKKIEKEIELRRWDKKGVEQYVKNLENITLEKTKINESWVELKGNVDNCLVKKKLKINRNRADISLGWDRKCTRKKREVSRTIKKWRKGKCTRQEYLNKKKELKELVEEKEKAKKEKLVKEVRNIKSEAEAWKFINKFRKKKNNAYVVENIEPETWRRHFMELLGGEEKKNRTNKEKEDRRG
ncbi:uncharacterized protein [Temnothorax longispinosus]|uniref:uncharacterized protein n=1 Tax=Temnothorax longispinosus TaxID=300112 RepID=UPI003A99532F